MPLVNPPTPTSSNNIFWVFQDSSKPEDQDIWFDAIDHVEMEDTWFEGDEAFVPHEEHHTDPSSSAREAADSRVPFTEDCRRGVQQFVRTLGEYGESKMLSACLSKILPGTPASLVLAANSLYTAVTERRNIDTAALHALGLVSGYLPENINVVSQVASFIRDTVTGWTDETFLQQFLGNEENHTSIHLFTALAVTAMVAGRWMKDEGAPQRGVLKVPAFMANIFIRASHYWTALGNMAGSLPSGAEIPENTGPSQRAPAFEVDTQVEMTGDVCDITASGASAPRLTAFSSNSTARPEAYTRATVQNRPAPAPGKNTHLSVPEQAHYLAVDKLRQESGLSDLLYCTNFKTETRQQTNENIITNTHFNTKCDAIDYPEPLTKGADSIPLHADITETQVSSAATSRSGGDALLPLVMTGAAVVPVATSYLQALKSKSVIAAGATAALTGAGIGGKLLWDKLSTHNPEGRVDDIENNALKAKNENIKIINTLVNEGVLKKGMINKERLLSAVAEYLFGNEIGIAGSTEKVRDLARKILSTEGLYGGQNSEQLSTAQAESVVRAWVFKNILGMHPNEYIINHMRNDPHPEYYTISSICHLLSMNELLNNKNLHYKRIPSSQWGYLNAMWYSFLIEEMPFLIFSEDQVKMMSLNDYDFANLYSGTRFLKNAGMNDFTFEEAISTGQSIWDLAVSEGVPEDKLGFYLAPALLFNATKSIKKEQVSDFDVVNGYLQYRQEVSEAQKDIEDKYNKYLSATSAWLRKGKLADYIISQCPVLSPGLPDRADAIRTPEQQREKAVTSAKEWYLNGIDKPCKGAPESLNDEYHKLTANVADSFREIDKYLILAAISTLPDDEKDFIKSPDGTIYTATANIQMMQPGSLLVTNKHFIERTDLFIVKMEGEERIYALKAKGNGGYDVFRVDRDIKKYICSGIFGKSFDDYKITWDNIEDSQDINSFGLIINEPALIGNDNNIDTITNSLSEKHREHLYHALHEAGNDKSGIQKIWNVIKHLIPFYDCVEGSVNNNLEQAIPSCLMDAVSFIPVFGKAASLGSKFGMGLARGLRSGARVVVSEGVQAANRNLLREVSLPTTKELVSLGKGALSAADPGFQLLVAAARPGRDFAKKVAALLSDSEKTPGLAQKMASEDWLARFPQATSGKLIKGKLPGTELAVPVKVIDRLHDGRSVFVRFNPENGVLGGQKFICQESGVLESLPATVGKSRNIREVWTESNLADNDIIYTGGRARRGVGASKLCSARSPSPDIELAPLPEPPPITSEERGAIKAYTKSYYNDVNSFMNEGMPAEYVNPHIHDTLVGTVAEIRSLLNKIPPYEGTIYRGTMIPESVFNSLKVGDLVTTKTFMSCSHDINVALHHAESTEFPILFIIDVKKTAHDIASFSFLPLEKEVLIEDNIYFKVNDIQTDQEGRVSRILHLEEVPMETLSLEEKQRGINIGRKVLSMEDALIKIEQNNLKTIRQWMDRGYDFHKALSYAGIPQNKAEEWAAKLGLSDIGV